MSSQRDNPLVRFAAFWWGIGVFSLFGVVLLVIWFSEGGRDETNTLEQDAAAKRLEIRAKVDAAQKASLDSYKVVEEGKTVQVPPHVVFDHLGSSLLAEKPAPVKKPEQIVPGSVAAEEANKAPSADFEAVDALTKDAPVDPAVMETGKAGFMVCMACHGANGEGGPVGPPLAGSDWVTGPVSNLIRIQLRGLTGPLTVSGKEYNFPAPMAPLAYQTDEQVAAVLTYIRNSFGNKAAPVTAEQVKALRSEVGKPMLTEADLIKP